MISFLVLVGLFLIGIPVAYSVGLTALAFIPHGLLLVAPQRMINGIDSFVLMAVPFFILTGEVMNVGGITDRIFGFARGLVGHRKGGLGYVNVLASMIFSGMTGAAVADAAGLGAVEIRAMRKAKYDDGFSSAVTAASSVVGPIVPPSVPFVVYGSIVGVSVGKLLLAGAIPGLIGGIAMMVVVRFMAHRHHFERDPKSGLKEVMQLFWQALPALLTPVIIIGGIMSGFFTPTEAGAVAAVYAVILAAVVYREFDLRAFFKMLVRVVARIGSFLLIPSVASLYGSILTRLHIPEIVSSGLFGVADSRWIVLLMMNAVFLIVGCLIDSLSAMVILAPILSPLALQIGIDPIQWGVIIVFNLMVGAITPPMGVCMFITNKIAGVSMARYLKHVWPFLIALVGVLMLITFVPAVSMAVPNAVFK